MLSPRVLLALALFAPPVRATVGTEDVYHESGGVVVMEAERTPSSLGTGDDHWDLLQPGNTNYVDGATNGAHLEFQGNSSNGGPPEAPLKYTFKIHRAGYYHLHLRARARLDGQESDKNNDCYVRVNGDPYGAGPNAGDNHLDDAKLSLLTSDTKMYGGSATTWGWANLLDPGGKTNKRRPVYQFNAGGTYTLTISGRSIKYNIDRIVFRHTNVAENSAKSVTLPESSLTPENGVSPSVVALILVNADTGQDIGPLTDGATVNLAATGANLNFRAETQPSVVGSVRFDHDGAAGSVTDDVLPYTLAGNSAGGGYLPWTPALGPHSLVVTPYSEAGAGGTAGVPLALGFTVVNDPETIPPSANAGSDKTITLPIDSVTLAGSGEAPGATIVSHAWTQVSGPSTAVLSGAATPILTVSSLLQGSYLFRLTVTSSNGLTTSDDAAVTVNPASGGSGQAVTTLMLVNADTDLDIGPILDGAVIDFSVTGRNLNIRADTSPSSVGSVVFNLNGANVMTQSGLPYTIGGDALTDYWPWTPPLGGNTLTVTPYTSAGGTGTAGTPRTVTFTVIDVPAGDGISGFAPPTLHRLDDDAVRLEFSGVPGLRYTFQRSVDLTEWTTLESLTAAADGSIGFTDPDPPSGKAYYRLAAP